MALKLLKLPNSCYSCAFPNTVSLGNTCSYERWGKVYNNLAVRSFAANKSANLEVKKKKKRLDEICLERFQQYSRTYIQSWILQVPELGFHLVGG